MPRLLVFMLLFSLGLLIQCEPEFQPFVLADQQNPCTIVIDQVPQSGLEPAAQEAALNATPAGRAAVELRHYLCRILSLPERAIAIRDDRQPLQGRIILLGKPGAKSAFAGAARIIEKRRKSVAAGQTSTVRFDGWSDKEQQVLAITVSPDASLLRAVYAFLDGQGVRWIFPGRLGENIEMRREIRVQQAAFVPSQGLPLCGFFSDCSTAHSAAPDSSWLIWWARQRFTYVPLQWAQNPQQLQRWGLKGTAETHHSLQTIWRPGFCVSDEAAINNLLRGLISEQPEAALYLLDAAKAAPLCACPKCQALGSETDRWLQLVGRIGREMAGMKKQGALQPEARLLAVREPQLPERLQNADWPREQVLLAARMLPRCYNHAIADPSCMEANARVLSELVGWMTAHSFADLAVVEGYYAPEFAGLPLVLDKVIASDMEFYQRLGLRGLFCEAPATAHPGLQLYQDFVFAQSARHGHLNPDSLRQAYASFTYPGAATMTVEYLDMLEEAFANISAWRYELPLRVQQLEKSNFAGPLLPLERFHNHFTLYQQFPESDDGVAWERTFQLVHDARHVMDEMLRDNLPDQTLDRLLEAEKQLRFAELTVTFYDNMIRSLTLGEDEPEMREEAAIRLRQVVKKMEEFKLENGLCGSGTALEYSGLGKSAQALLAKLQKRYGLPYERVYAE